MGIRVLIVDDSATMREVIKIAFRRENINVVTCADAASALAQFDENPPDVVITDVIMPVMGGKELADRLQALNPNVKVLYVSGYTENTIVHHGMLDPGIVFLSKPFTPTLLARKVRQILDGGETPS